MADSRQWSGTLRSISAAPETNSYSPARGTRLVPFGGEPRRRENVRESIAEVTVGEKDDAQAARSCSTACSISATLSR